MPGSLNNKIIELIAPCKGIQDSLGFWIPRRGRPIPGTGFQLQWKLASGFQSLMAFPIL